MTTLPRTPSLLALVAALAACAWAPPEEAPAKPARPPSASYSLTGFRAYEEGERLWVFAEGAAAEKEFLDKGEPAKRVTRIGGGPGGRTIMGDENSVLVAYSLAWKHTRPGFVVLPTADGRLWVFAPGSAELEEHRGGTELAKRATLVGAGPEGRTLLGGDAALLKSYAGACRYSLPGFEAREEGGRIWVFRAGSADLQEFLAKGEPSKRVTKIGTGPEGRSLMGADAGTLDDYALSWRHTRRGFAVLASEGRLWVFRTPSRECEEFLRSGDAAKRVALISAGPEGRTLYGPDRETLEAYLGAEVSS